jgi:trans-aconitate methyltransferase
MIGKRDEYERMYQAEQRLWWYRVLHQKVGTYLQKQFGERADLAILDAGCGTGGMLLHLKKQGFDQIEGFDYDADGVAFSQERGLAVVQHDLTQIATYQPGRQYDVIICNDVFTYFPDQTIIGVMAVIRQRLKPGGLFITNNNAHAAFAGIHDVVVGGQKRFVQADMKRLAAAAGLRVTYATYWSLLLSPLIMVVRAWQRFQMRRGKVDFSQQASDVAVPPALINQTLYGLVKLEEALLPSGPFGSSIFTVMNV